MVCAVDKPHAHRAKSKGFDKGQMHAGIVVLKVRARTRRGAICTACACACAFAWAWAWTWAWAWAWVCALQVRHGEDLVAKDLITGKSDPYVKFKCAGQKVRRRAQMHMHARITRYSCACACICTLRPFACCKEKTGK